MSKKIDEDLYEYCSEQMDMMLEDLEKDGKLKDEKDWKIHHDGIITRKRCI